MGLAVKHQQLAHQVEDFANSHRKNSMASSSSNNTIPDEGTSFAIGSWVFTTNSLGGFNSHLAEPRALEVSATNRRIIVDEFTNELDKISLLVHAK